MSSFGQPAIEIPFMTSAASHRIVIASFFSDSASTRPANNMQGSQATLLIGPNAISTASTWRSSGTSTGPGAYYLVLNQSECSAQGGPGYVMLYTSTATVGTVNIPLYFPRVDSYDTMRYGLFALPNAAPAVAGGLLTVGTGAGQITPSGGSVGLVPGIMSGVSVEVKATGIVAASVGAGNYSGMSVEIKTGGIQTASIGAGTYSSVTIQGLSNYANISNVTLAAGTHSGATIQGLNRLNSSVTLNADTHSGATIAGIVAGGLVAGSIAAGAITSAKFAAGAIDGLALATAAEQAIADAILGRNVAGASDGGRTVSQALYVLRNKVAIGGSTVTVYQVDDATSSWTGAVTTGTVPISGVDPNGP